VIEQLLLDGMPGPLEGPGVPPTRSDLSPTRRRTAHQRAVIGQGGHPLGLALRRPLALHADLARKCGNCRFRVLVDLGTERRYPKCTVPRGPFSRTIAAPAPRVSAGSGTDVRKWWPACTDHEYGDPAMGPDAARSGPSADDQ
jgi:hypothetical protein